MTMSAKPNELRWKQRFENFEKARKKLNLTLEAYEKDNNNEIYQMALIQSFEFTYELGWKCVKDYIRYQGVKKVSFPREVIKHAFHHNIIEDGQTWIDMIEDRNLMSHTYDEEKAINAACRIAERYVKAIDQLYDYLKERLD